MSWCHLIDNVEVKSHCWGCDVDEDQVASFILLMLCQVLILVLQKHLAATKKSTQYSTELFISLVIEIRFPPNQIFGFPPSAAVLFFIWFDSPSNKRSDTSDFFDITLIFPLMSTNSTSVLNCENHSPATLDLDTLSRFIFPEYWNLAPKDNLFSSI